MNTRNRITLLLAAIIVVALLVVGMTLTTSAANEGDLVTEYGVVPAANANDNFAIFHKAVGADEYTFFASASNPFANGIMLWKNSVVKNILCLSCHINRPFLRCLTLGTTRQEKQVTQSEKTCNL